MNDDVSGYAVNTYSYTFDHTALETIERLSNQGYRHFELMMFPGHIWPSQASATERKAIAQYVSSNQLSIKTLNQPNIDINIGAAVPEMREYSVGAIEKIFLLAADLGSQGVIIGPGKPNPLLPAPYEVMKSRFFAALDRFVLLSERLGVQILLENMPFGFVPDARSLIEILDEYGSSSIGIVYDVANGAFIGEDTRDALTVIGDRFKYIHLSDTPAHVCKHDPISIGDAGIVPFRAIRQALAEMGHNEPPIIEIVSHEPDREIRSSIKALREAGWP